MWGCQYVSTKRVVSRIGVLTRKEGQMAKGKMLQIRVTEEQLARLKEKAVGAGETVSAYLLSRGLDEQADASSPIPGVKTGTGEAAQVPSPRRVGKLCAGCAKGGAARWNCPTCWVAPAEGGAA